MRTQNSKSIRFPTFPFHSVAYRSSHINLHLHPFQSTHNRSWHTRICIHASLVPLSGCQRWFLALKCVFLWLPLGVAAQTRSADPSGSVSVGSLLTFRGHLINWPQPTGDLPSISVVTVTIDESGSSGSGWIVDVLGRERRSSEDKLIHCHLHVTSCSSIHPFLVVSGLFVFIV